MSRPRQFHRASTKAMSALMMGIGIALVVRTLLAGGGPLATGILLGAMFVVVGVVRLYLQSRQP